MFEGSKRRGKASQETQSSITKIFQALKDNKCSDGSSETVNLVKTTKNKCKNKTGTQTEKHGVPCECNNTAGQQTNVPCPSNRDDTFSFTSCSLKKLITSESPKLMMALMVLGAALLILLLLKCICCPTMFEDLTEEKRERRSDDATKDDRKPWEKSKSRLMNEFAQLTGKDTKESNLHSGDVDYPEYMLPELSSILDPVKVNEGYGSNNLREFYRKLLKTDIQIKNLKKGFTNIKRGNSIDFTDPNSPRMKRSYKMFRDTSGSHAGSSSLKRRIENHKHNLREWRVDNDYGNAGNDDADLAQPGGDSPLERIQEKQKELKLETNTATAKDVPPDLQPTDKANNALEHFHTKHLELFNALFGRDRPSTQHRRLLQHDDDEDKDEGKNYDYEDQTKEPWDREKRTINPADLNNEKESDPIHFPKTINSETKTPTPEYNTEINYLIEAAVRMAKGKLGAVKYNEKYPNSVRNSNAEYFEDNINYADLVEMAQAYSDYGVLNNKKEIVEKNKPLGNTIKLLTAEKPREILEHINKVDNSLHGQRVKLKSNTEKPTFFKKLRFKMFSNNLKTTTAAISLTAKIANFTHFMTSAQWNVFGQKKAQKHKERNVMYSGHKRSLKSVEIEEINDDAAVTDNDEKNFNNKYKFENNEDSTIVNAKVYTNNVDLERNNEGNKSNTESNKKNVSMNIENIAPKLSDDTLKRNNTSWGLGEIFSMFAEFFMFLSGFDENREENGYGFLYNLVTMLNPNYSQTKNKTTQAIINVTIAPIEASIDSEMVDNIGHRSRVLLSFEEKAENATELSVETEDKSESYVITTNKEITNATKDIKIANSSITETKNSVHEAANRTVVKRSANGNVIFWNDLYDDEYGIKDPMEDEMKEKSSVKFNDLMGKDNWISNKFKILAKNWKERRNRKLEAKKSRKIKNSRNKTKAHAKRAVPVTDFQVSGKNIFDDLTANMKRVCHEAAEAIRESTNREVRADTGQTSTLMQQLVSLMSELVDMQVRAKTCVQLPEDLRSFLAWLTAPNVEERDEFSVNSYEGPNSINSETYDLLSTNARSECLGTIQDVEDLIMQYDEMSEEDKSKMSGVREYLEHQLYYLHKQLSNFNEYGSSYLYQEPTRRRRQPKSIKKQRKRKPYRFINYGRRATKSTEFDDLPTEDYKPLKFGKHKGRKEYYKHDDIKDREAIENNFGNNNVDNDKAGNRKNENGMKRNLKDDYYSDLVKNNDTIFKVRA